MSRERPILVTGATGFIAGHVISELLRHGYDVRATVRDSSRADVDHLRAVAREEGYAFDLVEASLDADDGWSEALRGAIAVIHVASPLPKSRPRDPDEVIRPAVDGTERVLRAAIAAGAERVVMTSSIAAVLGGHDLRDGRVRTEEDWSIVERCEPYEASKTLAERAAWEVAAGSELELVTICPGFVLGPLQRAGTNTSMDVVDQLLARTIPAMPHMGFSVVDVRDVAIAHRLALEKVKAAGHRYIVAGDATWLSEIAEILAAEYRPRGYRVPTAELPAFVVRAGALVNPSLRLAVPLLDQPILVSSARARGELGWRRRPMRETVIDAAESLIAFGRAPGRR
ncbi:NAD-dependent epimerase/dehydratase family protein [Microbacterium sp. BK668]|uniref:NAD-dependent epimerase/dehydratase family protein n=1 Tax=Microbacterium sp. BK668 TaxID=2512118 RepID=UPI00105E6B6E|nr:NAD-dependent epimerase/dehydratase family protein [Microbacterium sp. BK668]TDN91844.1 nucleoside-diphosphate-sugar epimerase [Microbacterium sp. BK668]